MCLWGTASFSSCHNERKAITEGVESTGTMVQVQSLSLVPSTLFISLCVHLSLSLPLCVFAHGVFQKQDGGDGITGWEKAIISLAAS